MLSLEKILEMWKKDAVINENHLDEASIESAKLHSKYLEILSAHRMLLKRKEAKFNILLKQKFLWYNGKMTKDEMDSLGWSYDPLDGLKILKGDMDRFYEADEHIIAAKQDIDDVKITVETLEEIINNIKWRHQSIKNAIDWRRFTSGV
jgi:Recombination, repair and ssDNA binding protein UvsY.